MNITCFANGASQFQRFLQKMSMVVFSIHHFSHHHEHPAQ